MGIGAVWTVAKMVTGLGGMGSSRQLDTIDKGVGHIASGLDKLHFGEQERSEHNGKILDHALEFFKLNMDQNSERSRIRRVVAVLWIRCYLFLIFGSVVAKIIEKRFPIIVDGVIIPDPDSVSIFILDLVKFMNTGTLMVLGFFFGVHVLRGFVSAQKKKK